MENQVLGVYGKFLLLFRKTENKTEIFFVSGSKLLISLPLSIFSLLQVTYCNQVKENKNSSEKGTVQYMHPNPQNKGMMLVSFSRKEMKIPHRSQGLGGFQNQYPPFTEQRRKYRILVLIYLSSKIKVIMHY